MTTGADGWRPAAWPSMVILGLPLPDLRSTPPVLSSNALPDLWMNWLPAASRWNQSIGLLWNPTATRTQFALRQMRCAPWLEA